MGNIPNDRNALLAFAQAHYPLWEEAFAAIGISEEQAASIRTAALSVQARTLANNSLRTQLRTSTQVLSEDYGSLRRAVSGAVRSINAFAQNSANPNQVYAAAQIAPPAPRGPSVPPASPTDLTVALDPVTGALTLRWHATQPRGVNGVVYSVRRRVGEAGPYTSVGSTGLKRIEDDNLPSAPMIFYTVQAQRGSLVAPMMAAITVRFGAGGGGVSVSATQIPSIQDTKAAA